MIVYGSGISDGNRHNHDDLPILLAGKGGGTIKPGRHVRYPEGDAADEPVRLHARPRGRPRRLVRRQHGDPARTFAEIRRLPLFGVGRLIAALFRSEQSGDKAPHSKAKTTAPMPESHYIHGSDPVEQQRLSTRCQLRRSHQ